MNHPSKHERRLNAPLGGRLRAQVRDAILGAAEYELALQGLHAARMDDIAARAGVSVGTLYNYFGDRSRLVEELLQMRGDGLLVELDSRLRQHAQRPFAAQLREFLLAMFEHFERHRRLWSEVMDAGEVPASGPSRSARRGLKRAILDRLRLLVDRGVACGALDPAAAELYPALLLGMWRGALAHTVLQPSSSEPGVPMRAELCARVFLDGAQAR